MTLPNHDHYRQARALVESGIWRVDADQGLVIGKRGRAFSHLTNLGYVQCKFIDQQTRRLHYVLTHRVIWESVHGPIEGDIQVNHINGVKNDNRIQNLELATPSQNILHAHRTGLARPRFGTENNSRLTDAQALDVYRRAHAGENQRTIGAEYGIGQTTVSNIKLGYVFGHVTNHHRAAA